MFQISTIIRNPKSSQKEEKMSPKQSQTLEKTLQPQKRRHGAQAAKTAKAGQAAKISQTAEANTNPSKTKNRENQKIFFTIFAKQS